jgi:hypothetical protein
MGYTTECGNMLELHRPLDAFVFHPDWSACLRVCRGAGRVGQVGDTGRALGSFVPANSQSRRISVFLALAMVPDAVP